MSKRTQCYHSELVSAGTWVPVTITSDVLRSKFNKPGENKHYCEMTINGIPRSYFVENDACGNALRGRKNQTLNIYAQGRDADATIEVDPNAPPAQQQSAPPPQQHQPPPPQQRQPPPQQQPQQRDAATTLAMPQQSQRGGKAFVWDELGKLANLYLMAEMRVLDMPGFDPQALHDDATLADIAERRITTLFIQGARMDLQQHLPMKLMQPKATGGSAQPPLAQQAPPPQQTQPPPAPEPATPPEGDDVPF